MEKIIELVAAKDYRKILNWAKQLTEKERKDALDKINQVDIRQDIISRLYKENTNQDYTLWRSILQFMSVTCLRNWADYKKDAGNNLCWYMQSPEFGIEPLIAYFKLFPPDYLEKVLDIWKNARQNHIHFQMLWELYKNGWIAFQEEFFVNSLFIIQMFNRSVSKDIDYLVANPETIDNVLLQFYKYEIPILDISKWKTASGKGTCAKCYEYWEEVFRILLERGIIHDRAIVPNLLGTLSFNWKKGHLDWHVRMIKMFEPTLEELVANQNLLFAAAYSTNNTVINFIVQEISSIYKDNRFDSQTFFQAIPAICTHEKCDKSIMLVLDIADWLLENKKEMAGLGVSVANALIQPSEKIQEKAAGLLCKYISSEELQAVVEPFRSFLKEKARALLSVSTDIPVEEDVVYLPEHTPLIVPDTWENWLFHVGKTIGALEPVDIELFYEGLIQIQEQIPDDYQSQLKPFTKKLFRRGNAKAALFHLAEFFYNWFSGGSEYMAYPALDAYSQECVFLRNKNKWVLDKLSRKSKLPLLSTPTHKPFFVHPAILVERMLAYEKAGDVIEMEDLLIACNRILKVEITADIQEQAKLLKGKYAEAVRYLFGMTDRLSFDEETLPLWTQVARTRNPDGVFTEFENTPAAGYPTVVRPFVIPYEIKRTYSDDKVYHWDRIFLEDNWNYNWWKKNERSYPRLYYYTAFNEPVSEYFDCLETLYYRISLVPHYADPWLLRFLPDTVSGNEADELRYGLLPLKFLMDNGIRTHHSGWIYIACCLLFEKKESRQLASSYVQFAIQQDFLDREYLIDCITHMILQQFAPINRLTEFFEGNYSRPVKEFQLNLIANCIKSVNKEHLPSNFKKLVGYYKELGSQLVREPDEEIMIKLKSLKK